MAPRGWEGHRQHQCLMAVFRLQVLTSTDEIEMWGDGKQTRSFTFIDDCVEGILRITKSDFTEVCTFRDAASTTPEEAEGSGSMLRPDMPEPMHSGARVWRVPILL